MNSLERVRAAVMFQEPDRTPVIAQVFGHAARLAGAALDDYVQDGETLARCQLSALERYGYDAVFSVMDASVETEAAGATLRYRKDLYPAVERYALSDKDDWDALPVPDPFLAGRMPEMLRALGILRRELGDETLVVGCVLGPFTLATQLIGMEKALYLVVDNPRRLGRLIDFATEVIIRFGLAQIRSGAHLPIVFDPSASPAVIPPDIFREFELPRLQRVFQAFKGAGAAAGWLHTAGPADNILPYYPAAGVDTANFHYCTSPEKAAERLPGACLDGNIKSVAFIEGTPSDIGAEAKGLIRAFRGRGGFILSSGCEIPPESRPENIAALVGAARTNQP